MKKITYLSILIIFILCSGLTAKAQLQPGMIDMTPSSNATINNSINSARTRILMSKSRTSAAARAGAARQKNIENRGDQIIKAGNANLMFTPSYSGTVATIKFLKFDTDEPQDLAGQVKLVQLYVVKFNELMTKINYKVNNVADGFALSYAIAYEAYCDKYPDSAKINRLRLEHGEMWLRRADLQGLLNVDRQASYEYWALMAMQGLEQRQKANQARTRLEREQAEDKIKRYINLEAWEVNYESL